MNDSSNTPRSIEDVWCRLVADARRARKESASEDYFLGIFEGYMGSIATLASYLGRMHEYKELCFELEDIAWSVED